MNGDRARREIPAWSTERDGAALEAPRLVERLVAAMASLANLSNDEIIIPLICRSINSH